MATIDADVKLLFTTKAAFPTLSPGDKYQTKAYDPTLGILMIKSAAADTIEAEFSKDTLQCLLAGAQNVSGVKTFTNGAKLGTGQLLGVTGSNGLKFDASDKAQFTNVVGFLNAPDLGVNVHIKTADSSALSVNSSADDLIIENSVDSGVTILSGAASSGNIYFGDSGSSSIGRLVYDHSDNSFSIFTNSSRRLIIDSVGRVGFGTPSPSSVIDVTGNHSGPGDAVIIDPDYTITSGTTAAYLSINTSGVGSITTQDATVTYSRVGSVDINEPIITKGATDTITRAFSLRVAGAPTEGVDNYALLVDSGASLFEGGVSIAPSSSGGTAGGGADELVIETSAETGMTIFSGPTSNGNIYFGDSGSSSIGRLVYNHNDNSMSIYTNSSPRLLINSSGNVGIGDFTPTDARFKVEDVALATDHIAYFYSNSAQSGDGIRVHQDGAATGTTIYARQDGTGDILSLWDGATNVFTITDGGRIGILESSPNSVLDLTGPHSVPGMGVNIDPDLTMSGGATTGAFLAINTTGAGSIITEDATVTYSMVGTVDINEPLITKGATDTITTAYTLRVADAPSEGTNNYSLWVDGGLSRFDGDVAIGGVLSADSTLHVHKASAGAVTAPTDTVITAENSGSTYLSLIGGSGAGNYQGIYFYDNSNYIRHNENSNTLYINSGGVLQIDAATSLNISGNALAIDGGVYSYIRSDANVYFVIDNDDDGTTNLFDWSHNGSTQLMTLEESGTLTLKKGKLQLDGAETTYPSLNIPTATAAPTSPTTGDMWTDPTDEVLMYRDAFATNYVALSDGGAGGSGSAGAGNQYIEITLGSTTYKVLHDGTV